MTISDYEYIISVIKDRSVEPPSGYTTEELNCWLTGYAKCQLDIIDEIENRKFGCSN